MTVLDSEFLDTLKTKLVYVSSTVHSLAEKKREISKDMGSTIKWFEEARDAICESIRFKYDQPLVDLFGPDWESTVSGIKASPPAHGLTLRYIEEALRIAHEYYGGHFALQTHPENGRKPYGARLGATGMEYHGESPAEAIMAAIRAHEDRQGLGLEESS